MAGLEKTDTSVHASGAAAEELGKERAVDRETESATVHQERTSDGSVSRFHFVRSGG